jgi:hypothetical protein
MSSFFVILNIDQSEFSFGSQLLSIFDADQLPSRLLYQFLGFSSLNMIATRLIDKKEMFRLVLVILITKATIIISIRSSRLSEHMSVNCGLHLYKFQSILKFDLRNF